MKKKAQEKLDLLAPKVRARLATLYNFKKTAEVLFRYYRESAAGISEGALEAFAQDASSMGLSADLAASSSRQPAAAGSDADAEEADSDLEEMEQEQTTTTRTSSRAKPRAAR